MQRSAAPSSSALRVPSTVKKAASSTLDHSSSSSFGQYRPLGPKIHEFGRPASPLHNAPVVPHSPQNNLYEHYLNQRSHPMQTIIPSSSQQTAANNRSYQPIETNQQNYNISSPAAVVTSVKAQQQKQLQQSQQQQQKVLSPMQKQIQQTHAQKRQHQSSQSFSGIERQPPRVLSASTVPSSSTNHLVSTSKVEGSGGTVEGNIVSVESEQALSEVNGIDQSNDERGSSPPLPLGVNRDNSISSLKQQLQTIFHFYTSFGDRQNITNLKSSKFTKLLVDAGIVGPILSTTRVDLLFCQANRHQPNMSFEKFLDTLPKLAALVYSKLTPQEAMMELITNHFTLLYLNIMQKTDLGFELSSFSQPLEIDCIEILQPLYPMLQKIYETYFAWEQSAKGLLVSSSRTLKALLVFLCEFEICPLHFSKSTAFLLFNYLIELKSISDQFAVSVSADSIFGFVDFGQKLTFQRFLTYLIRSAIISYENRVDQSKYTCSSHLEKLNLLLERMEVSPGFLNIQKKTHSTNNSHTSLLIPSSLVTQLSMSKSIDWSTPRASQVCSFQAAGGKQQQQLLQNSGSQSPNSFFQRSSTGSFFNSMTLGGGHNVSRNSSRSSSNRRKSFLAERLCASTFGSQDILEKHREQITKIFRSYCSFGEPMNQSTLKTIKLIKLLTDADILKKSSQNRHNSSSRLNLSSVSRNSSFNRGDTPEQHRKVGGASTCDGKQKTGGIALNLLDSHEQSSVMSQSGRVRLSKIDMDFMVVKLTGHRWIKTFNSAAKGFNDRVASPKLGFSSHLFRNDESIGAKGKIEIEHFFKLLEMIAEKLYPNLEPQFALQIIIEEHVLKIKSEASYSSSSKQQTTRKTMQDYLLILVETLKDEDVVSLLGEVHQSIAMYYKFYQDRRGEMNVRQFIKFFQDFDIFPSLISKARVSIIFYTLAGVLADQKAQKLDSSSSRMIDQSYASNNSRKMSDSMSSAASIAAANLPEQEVIDQHLFVEAIALLAFEIYTEQHTSINKVIMILERMNSSNGPVKIQKKLGHTRSTDGNHWDMLHFIRKKFPEFYMQRAAMTMGGSQSQQSNRSIDQMQVSHIGGFDAVMRQGGGGLELANTSAASLGGGSGGSGSRRPIQQTDQQRRAYYASHLAANVNGNLNGKNNYGQSQPEQEDGDELSSPRQRENENSLNDSSQAKTPLAQSRAGRDNDSTAKKGGRSNQHQESPNFYTRK